MSIEEKSKQLWKLLEGLNSREALKILENLKTNIELNSIIPTTS